MNKYNMRYQSGRRNLLLMRPTYKPRDSAFRRDTAGYSGKPLSKLPKKAPI